MDEATQKVLQAVTEKTQSELILFFVLVLAGLTVVMLPLYRMVMSDRKSRAANENTRQDKYIERESRIIDVISNNSEIIAGLKATLETSHAAHTMSLGRIHERIDGLCASSGNVATTLAQAMTLFDEIVRRQQNNAEDIKKLLQLMGNTP